MKKLLLIISVLFTGLSTIYSQTSIELTNGSAGGLILNNSFITEDVVTGGQSHVYIQLKNISSTSKTYALKRTDVVLNSGADAYFCFGGQCFPTTTTMTPVANYLTLNAGQSDTPQSLYYDETVASGYSEIKYELFDVNNPSDALIFTFKFNPLLASVKSNASLFSSVSNVYPNPSVNKAHILINSTAYINDATVIITNALGSVVSSKNIDLFVGKNAMLLDTENLTSGIYHATISSSNNTKVVKKFIVNK